LLNHNSDFPQCYREGIGVERDYELYMKWHNKSLEEN
jgi:TPR repeat protein